MWGEIFIDSTGKKNGRGAYICKSIDCFNIARKTRSLSHEFSCEIPEEVYDEITKLLEGLWRRIEYILLSDLQKRLAQY